MSFQSPKSLIGCRSPSDAPRPSLPALPTPSSSKRAKALGMMSLLMSLAKTEAPKEDMKLGTASPSGKNSADGENVALRWRFKGTLLLDGTSSPIAATSLNAWAMSSL
jgi:hypothetical protein